MEYGNKIGFQNNNAIECTVELCNVEQKIQLTKGTGLITTVEPTPTAVSPTTRDSTSLVPRPLLREKGPGTHCMRMR